MKESYHVRIEHSRLTFCAAHFITFGGDVCERLHGHNYHVAAEIHGPLDGNHYVVDFIAACDSLQEIVDALDHRMLLPTEHPTISVAESPGLDEGDEGEVLVAHGRRRWSFPRHDCVLLPLSNTTAELLARYIARQLQPALLDCMPGPPSRILVSVDECDGQQGVCELSSGD